MNQDKTIFNWLTHYSSTSILLLLWVIAILIVAISDFVQIKLGTGDYLGIDKTTDIALIYSLIFNSVAVASNSGGAYTPTGWCMFSNVANTILGLLFYGVFIAKIVYFVQERKLRDISRKVNLMMDEEDWDALMDALRDRANRLKLGTSADSDSGKMFLFREIISYVEKLLQQRPAGYHEDSINMYELEAILRYSLDGIEACENIIYKPAAAFHRHSLYAILREYRNSLIHADSPFIRDSYIQHYFDAIANKCLTHQ